MKKRLLKIAVILLILLTCFLIPSEIDVASAEIVQIPIEDKSVPEPDEKYYTENGYEDPSITVTIEYGRAFDGDPVRNTDYVVARIKLANATQIRSFQASENGKSTSSAIRLAAHAGAVIAMNGDFYRTFAPEYGRYIIRQGIVKMKNPQGFFDSLVIDGNGDLHIFQQATREDIEGFDGTIVNCYSFGPGLVIDGEKVEQFINQGYGPKVRAQRSALCQVGPLEYLIAICAGPDNPGSTGLVIEEWAEVVYSLGVRQAYNLDGGTSASLVFRGEKLNTFGAPKSRQINDIICFVSAWRED